MAEEEASCEVLIVGAGPVGLLLANMLGAAGVRAMVLERETEFPGYSRAIGIMPGSLEILSALGLDAELVRQGVSIRDVEVFGGRGRFLGRVTFRNLACAYPFILSLPQVRTISLLREALRNQTGVDLRPGCRVTRVTQDANGCDVHVGESGETVRASYVVGCDGARSVVRASMHAAEDGAVRIPPRVHSYPCHFVMGDFSPVPPHVRPSAPGQPAVPDEIARLYFTEDGAVESFPMPDGVRRWIVQTPYALDEIPPGLIPSVVHARTGIALEPALQLGSSTFTPRAMNSAAYVDRRIVLCGDAAHLMSPIGGQGMNCGFADAEYLAEVFRLVLREGADAGELFRQYETLRHNSSAIATRRAEQGMRIGTWRGAFKSRARELIFRHLLLRGPLASLLPPHFSMLSLPGVNLARLDASRRPHRERIRPSPRSGGPARAGE